MTTTENRFAQQAKRPPAAISEPPAGQSRFTLNLSAALRQAAAEDVQRLRAATRANVTLADVTRHLLWVLHEDESLYAEVQRRIGR